MSAWAWLGVAALGAVGASARFLLGTLVTALAGDGFPFGTLAINVSGSLLLGLLTGLALSGNLLVLLGSATLGSYTTFSTWMLDTERLTVEGRSRAALLNVLVSLALGFGAAALGRVIGTHL